jgi:Pectate lyase superfamily protein
MAWGAAYFQSRAVVRYNMRKILAIVLSMMLGVTPALAQTGSGKTPAALATETNVLWPDNTVGLITPYNARQTLLDIIASYISNTPGTPVIFSSDIYFGSGRPWFDVRAFGATGNGSTDDSAAAQNAENATVALGASGSLVYWSNGVYCVNSGLTVPNSDVRNVGTSVGASYVKLCNNNDVTTFTLNGTRDTLEHLHVTGANLTTTTHPAILVNLTGVNAKLDDVLVQFGSVGVQDDSGDVIIRDSTIQYAYNANVETLVGDALYFLRSTVDQGTPNNTTCTAIGNWSATSSVSAGDCKTVSSTYVIQYTGGGTTGGSAPTIAPYFQNITDGSATGQLMRLASFDGIQLNTFVNFIEDADVSGPFTSGIHIQNSAAGNIVSHTVLVAVGANSAALRLSTGIQNIIDGNSLSCAIAGCLGLDVESSYTGSSVFVHNSAYGVNQQCFILQAGSHYFLTGNLTGGCGEGLYIAAAVTSVNSTANNWGGDATNGANTIGIDLPSGASDYIQSVNDDVKNANTPISNSSSGTHNVILASAGTPWTIPNYACPVPSASALGCVESITSLAHNWVAYIDTSGIPHQLQPSFSDVSGSATNAQLPVGGALTVKGSLNGSSEVDLTGAQVAQISAASRISVVIPNIPFGVANQTTTINFTLPSQFTNGNYTINLARLSAASGTLTAATVCLSSATACGGTQYVASGTAVTVSTAATNTVNNMQSLTIANTSATQSININPLYFEVQNASAAPQTVTLTLELTPES